MTDRAGTGPSPAAEPLPPISGPVLVGVLPGQMPVVLRHAARLALSLSVPLVCAYVDVTGYLVAEGSDGAETVLPVDPDPAENDAEGATARLEDTIAAFLAGQNLEYSFHRLAGDPARALGRFADTVDPSLIVVGSRERGIGARLEHLLAGSIAVHLTDRQHRPVVVVPTHPRGHENRR